MKKITILIILLINSIWAFGQDIDLTTLPKAERDSILIARTEQVVLKYGDPEFLNTGQAPLISHHKNDIITNRGTAETYMVTYLYDPYQFAMHMPFIASVTIFANTGKVYDVFFGTGIGIENLDIRVETDYFPYRQLETNPQIAARILEKQQHFINQAAEYEREGATTEAGSVGGGTIKPPTTRPSK